MGDGQAGTIEYFGAPLIRDAAGETIRLSPQQHRIFSVLALNVGRPVSRDTLIDNVWPDRPDAYPVLKQQISMMRRALDGVCAIHGATGTYTLRCGRDQIDVLRFERLAVEALADADDRVASASVAAALSMWRDELFATLDGDVVDTWHARLSLLKDRLSGRLGGAPGSGEALALVPAGVRRPELTAPILPDVPPRTVQVFVGRSDLLTGLTEPPTGLEVVAVTGPAGIGKTTLVLEALRRFDGQCLYGRVEPELFLPLSAWRAALGMAVDFGAFAADRDDQDARQNRLGLFEEVAGVLANLAVRDPVTVVIDDAHHADDPTLLLALHLVEHHRHLPLRLVLAARGGPDEPAALADLRDRARRVERFRDFALDGWSAAEVRDVLLARAADSVGQVAEVARLTGGNPFLVNVMADALRVAPDSAEAAAARAAAAAGDLLAGSMRSLDDDHRRLVEACALTGSGFDLTLAAAVGGTDEDTALERMDAMVVRSVLAEVEGEFEQYQFVHELLRAHVIGRMTNTFRSRLHLRLAETMEACGWAARHPQGCADQFLAADERFGGRAVPHLLASAERFYEGLDFERAVVEADRARSLLAADDHERHAEAAVLAAIATSAAGRLKEARERFCAAVDVCKLAKRDDLLVRAVIGATGDSYLEFQGADSMSDLLDEAIAAVVDPACKARLLARGAQIGRDDADRRRAQLLAAESLVDDIDAPEAMRAIEHGWVLSLYGSSHIDDRLMHSMRELDLARRCGGLESEVAAAVDAVTALIELGRTDEAEALVQRCTSDRRPALPITRWWMLSMQSVVFAATARLEAAQRCALDGFLLGKRIGIVDAAPWYTMQQFSFGLATGDYGAVADRLRRGATLAEMHPSWLLADGVVAFDTGDVDRAEQSIDRCADLSRRIRRDHTWSGTCYLFTALAGRLGRHVETDLRWSERAVYGVACAYLAADLVGDRSV